MNPTGNETVTMVASVAKMPLPAMTEVVETGMTRMVGSVTRIGGRKDGAAEKKMLLG